MVTLNTIAAIQNRRSTLRLIAGLGLFGVTRALTAGEPTSSAEKYTIEDALQLVRQCKERYATVRDYSTTFVKQELIGGQMTPINYIDAKFRSEPFSVYFRWRQPETGKEAIFVEGANDNKIVTHTTGFAKTLTGTLKIDVEGQLARKGNRHTIREAGIGNLIEKVLSRWEYEKKFNELDVTITNVKLNERPCYLIETVHPPVDTGKYMFHRFKLYIDKEESLPIRAEGYGYPRNPNELSGPLLESYTYLNVKTNVGFTDLDFSASNPKYGYSRF